MADMETTPGSSKPTTVVRIRRSKGVVVVGCDVYIGRPMFRGGWELLGSKWANPFKLDGSDGDRARALKSYEEYVRAGPLMKSLDELRGKRLGCWCNPLPCHGDVLVKLVAELDASRAPGATETPGATEMLGATGAPGATEMPGATETPDAEKALPAVPDDDHIWGDLGLE